MSDDLIFYIGSAKRYAPEWSPPDTTDISSFRVGGLNALEVINEYAATLKAIENYGKITQLSGAASEIGKQLALDQNVTATFKPDSNVGYKATKIETLKTGAQIKAPLEKDSFQVEIYGPKSTFCILPGRSNQTTEFTVNQGKGETSEISLSGEMPSPEPTQRINNQEPPSDAPSNSIIRAPVELLLK